MQTCIDKDGTMNTMCPPPSGLMLAQLKVETSKLLYPPLIPINGSMHLASDTNVIFDKVEKCLVNKLTNLKLDGYNLPPTMLEMV